MRKTFGRAAARSMDTADCVSAGLEPARRSWPWDAVRASSMARADRMCVKKLGGTTVIYNPQLSQLRKVREV